MSTITTTSSTRFARESQVQGESQNDASFERAAQGMLDSEFEDWPNEAGFEGLDEISGPVELTVKGSIPSWAAGSLYRTGPGQYSVEGTPKGTFYITHWFDGFGHTHRFDIIETGDTKSPVRVEYSSKRQSPELFEAVKRDGRKPDVGFGQKRDPCIGLFGKVMSVWRSSSEIRGPSKGPNFDNVCVTVNANVPVLLSGATESGHRGGIKSIWLGTDTGLMKEVDQDTLEPIGVAHQTKLHLDLKGPLSCAHAQRDPETGDFFNYNLEMGRCPAYRVFRANASTRTTDILATISGPDIKPAYNHSFFLSPSFVILCIPSTHLSFYGLSVPWMGNVADAIEPFNESKLCKWYVVDRLKGRGVVATFDSPAGFFFHSINSFEECNEKTGDIDLYCDVIEYPNTDVIRAFDMDVILNRGDAARNYWGDEERGRNCLARLTRRKATIPRMNSLDGNVSTTQVTSEKIFEIKAPHAGELPIINPLYATRNYRYAYSISNRGYSTFFDAIVKTDLDKREASFWENPKGHTPGEPIFVPRPRAQGEKELDEDDGVLLSVVLDGVGKTSYLLCLDAKTMKELGRAECGFPVAFGFHGLHAPSSSGL
ncbi:torulene oxygenase [Hypoxylon trugodes]|uniref:torulene oxygenase n=1 Tax=Hypoxylon trugodes TaxID=326681 RepID=UPI0021908943|nr:torulene oxygenase [Hypoxylon trugodes]KAI1389263.1 torulene oxygenase [Hypoxylon trugodes]